MSPRRNTEISLSRLNTNGLTRALMFGGLIALLMLFTASPLLAAPAVGAPAPEFRLQDQNGAWVSLKDFRGKWVVLYFYPKDNTPGCTTQACEFRDDIFAFRRAEAVILGISVDDVASKKDFAAEHSLPFSVLADPDKATTRRYGVLTKMMGLFEFARRDTFIIDPQGRIAKHFPKVDPDGHSAMVLAELKSLRGS